MTPSVRLLTRISHFLLYVLIIVILLTGWAMVSTSRATMAANCFWLFHWPNLPFFGTLPRPEKMSLHHTFNISHVALALSALVLVPIHIAGAFYHRGREDEGLFRMVPWAGIPGRAK